MTIAYIDPTLAIDDTTAVGWPFTSGATYTPTSFVGGSIGTGKIYNTPAAAYTDLGGGGHQFCLRYGYFHNRTGTALFAAFWSKSFCTVRGYGNRLLAKPVLDGFIYQSPTPANDALWTHSGGGVWYYEPPGAVSQCRSFRTGVGFSGDSNTSRVMGKYWRPASSAGNVTYGSIGETGGIWFGANSGPWRITVYTGSTTVAPPTFYNGITISQQGSGVANGLVCRNGGSYNIFKDFQIWGSAFVGCGAATHTTAGVDGISFQNVDMIGCLKTGFQSASIGASGYISRNVSWSGIYNAMISGPDGADTPTVDIQNDDIFQINENSEGTYIHDFQVYVGTVHTVLNMASETGGILYRPSQTVIRNGIAIMDKYGIDGRPIGVSAIKGLIIDNFEAYNFSTKAQIGGQDITIINSYFGPLGYNSDPSNQRSLLEFTNFAGDPAALNINVLHNVFDTRGLGLVKAAVGVNTYPTASFSVAKDQILLANNICIMDPQDGFFNLTPYNSVAQGFPMPVVNGTLSAATVGAGRTLNATSAFAAGDVGKVVACGAGRATITGYSSASNVTVNITVAFASTTLINGSWFLSTPITLSSAAVGAGRTVNSPSYAIFTAGDVGKMLYSYGGSGSATITGFTDASNITITIVTAFAGTSLDTGTWYISTPTSIHFQQILNNLCIRSDGSAGLTVAGNIIGTIQSDYFTMSQPMNGFMGASGNIGSVLESAGLSVGYVPSSVSPAYRAGVGVISRTDSAGNAYVIGERRDANGATFANPPSIGRYESQSRASR